MNTISLSRIFGFATICAIISMALPFSAAYAHGGGLNADGCHHNRKTGGYHCHRAPSRLGAPTSGTGAIKLAPSGKCYSPNDSGYVDITVIARFPSLSACNTAAGN